MKVPVLVFTVLINLVLINFPTLINSSKSTKQLTPYTFLETEDKQRLLNLLKLSSPIESNYDLRTIHYSLIGNEIISNKNINSLVKENDKKEICQLVKKHLDNKQLSVDNVFYATSINKLLNCQFSTTTQLTTTLNSFLKEDSKVQQIYHASLSLLNFGQKLDSNKISKVLAAALKKDETLESIGYAFQLAAHLTGSENFSPFVEKFGDVIVQADEVNGRFLQFEGGLSITSGIISGIYKLATVANKPTGLTNDQALKFVNYFLNRKTVQTVKGAAELLQVLELFVDNKYHIPVCVTHYKSRSVSISDNKPVATIKVTNVLGKSLGQNTKVSVQSTIFGGKKVFQNVVGDGSLFASEINKDTKRGVYTLTVDVSKGDDKRYIGNTDAQLPITLMTQVSLANVEFSFSDTDQTSSSKSIPLTFPSKISTKLEADYHQKLLLKFTLKDKLNSEIINAHQTFVLFRNIDTKQEIIFVAEQEKSTELSSYKFDLNLNTRGKDFGFKSGVYEMFLIVGDAVILNTVNWNICQIKLTFAPTAEDSKVNKSPWMTFDYKTKPEINHLFREQEKRPPAIVSNFFSLLVCVPFLILLVLWFRLGVNIRNMPFCLSLPIFHLSLGLIFGLFACFWLELDMFTTLKYLFGLGLITFLSGHNLLTRLAKRE